MKLCNQCKWHSINWIGQELCGRTEILSPVDGKPHEFCSVERMPTLDRCCGPNAKYWEEKPVTVKPKSWWRRLWA